MQVSTYLGDGDFWKGLLRLAIPIALQKLLVSSFSMVDTIMVGQLGEKALAAVGVAGQWSFLLNVVFFGLTSGASVFIAQYWGCGDIDGIYRTYGFAMNCAVVVSAIFSLIVAIFPYNIISLYTSDEAVKAEATAYFGIVLFSYTATAVNQVSGSVLCATEKVKLPMYISMASVVLNMALNALFMFGLGMGVRGAALGTLISTCFATMLTYIMAFRQKNVLIAPLKKLFDWKVDFVKRFLSKSAPVFLNESLWALGTTCYNMIYGQLSTEFFAAITIFRSIEGVMLTFFWGFCHACSVIIGKAVGAGMQDKAKLDARRFTVIAVLMSVALGGVMILSRDIMLMPFDISEGTRLYAMTILMIYGLELWLRNIPAITIVGIFRAGGDTRTGLIYDVVTVWLLALPATFISGVLFGAPLAVVYLLMLLVEDIVKCALCLRRLKSGRWIQPVSA
ncbi:MAG: MATE family efflux transporter [Clostridia bacterium]|nr:MATE family efflux transporter [Clostridia bacterium]